MVLISIAYLTGVVTVHLYKNNISCKNILPYDAKNTTKQTQFVPFCALCAIKYKIEISDKHISLKTLYIKKEIDITDIEKYKCKKARRTALYKFNLYINGKKVLICTRYKEEFENILKDNNVQNVVR